MLKRCRAERIHTAIDTTGYCDQQLLLSIAMQTDLILYDLKHMDDSKHQMYTGVSNARILDNLRVLASIHPQVHVRVPLIPGINDDDDNISKLGEFVSSIGRIRSITVLPYHRSGVGKYEHLSRDYLLADTRDPEPSTVTRVINNLSRYGLAVGGQ